jgi:hypothetical protein
LEFQSSVDKLDMASWFINEFHQLSSERSLQSRKNLLSGNTISVIVAGRYVCLHAAFFHLNLPQLNLTPSYSGAEKVPQTSDTTRATLISTWYFLAKYPEHAEKILSELRNVDETDANGLALLPHLNGVINETLRLVPPQMTGGGRITGPEGLWVDDIWIPGGTKVTAPKYVVSRRKLLSSSGDLLSP